MKRLIENERLNKVNEKIEEATVKAEKLQVEIDKIELALAETFAQYAVGDIDEKEIKAAEKLLHEKKIELATTIGMIQKLKAVRKPIALETIPLVRKTRQKKIDAIDAEWDAKVKKLKNAQAELLLCLEDLSKTRRKANSIAGEFADIVRELDPNGNHTGLRGKSDAFRDYRELPINPNRAYFGDEKALEMSFAIPEWAAKNALAGNLPQWVRDYEKERDAK